MRAKDFIVERKKRRRKSRGAFSGPGGWYGYYYGHSGEGEASGDGGGGESVRENSSSESNVIFLNDNAVIVGQEHGKKLQLSPDDEEKIRAIADEHGAWYEGNGMDQEFTKGIIDQYQGSWDDDLLSPKIKGYPAAFLYVLFSNVKENDTVKGKIGSDPESTIFDRILDTQPSANYFPDRKFDADSLEKFLQSVSEGPHDFVKMSQAPATEQNVTKFFTLGEKLMWPDNWEEYPYRAGRVAKSVNDLRDKFLASRKQGVYVTGSDHLKAVKQFLNQNITETFDNPYAYNWSRGDHGDYDVFVKLPDGSPLNIAFDNQGDDGWHVAFDRGHSQEVTGEGDAQRIFATVLHAIQQFIGKEHPDKVYFSASKKVEPGQNSESRANLYSRMVKRYASALGYDSVIDDFGRDSVMYILNKKQGVTEESFNGIDIDMDIEGDEIMVTAMGNGRELGHVLFVDEGEYLMPQDLEVDERFQGQGIAAAMYDYVKSKGYKIRRSGQQTDAGAGFWDKHRPEQNVWENFADGKVKGKSRPGRVKRAGASCNGSVTDLRARAKKASGEKAKMYHWCANMKSGRNK